ncbi:MAG: Phosphate transport ATP-binding protein PstB, partial [Cyanobacteriota bacterium]
MVVSNNISTNAVLKATGVNVFYGSHLAVKDCNIDIPEKRVVAFIGPSGCGKSTMLRCFNRMNDLVAIARVEGEITYRGKN